MHYNVNMKGDRKTAHIAEWNFEGVSVVGDLFNSDGNILSYTEFAAKFLNSSTSFLGCAGVVNAVRAYRERLNIDTSDYTASESKIWSATLNDGSKVGHSILVKTHTTPAGAFKWVQHFNVQFI